MAVIATLTPAFIAFSLHIGKANDMRWWILSILIFMTFLPTIVLLHVKNFHLPQFKKERPSKPVQQLPDTFSSAINQLQYYMSGGDNFQAEIHHIVDLLSKIREVLQKSPEQLLFVRYLEQYNSELVQISQDYKCINDSSYQEEAFQVVKDIRKEYEKAYASLCNRNIEQARITLNVTKQRLKEGNMNV